MNLVGYKWLDLERTRRSAEVLHMDNGETAQQFHNRCTKLGFEAVDRRNIIDKYKSMSDELIKGDLNARRFNFSVLLQNINGDFNKASIIRNNNAFCGQKVIIYGDKQYDRRGTCGTHVYENFQHVQELSCLNQLLDTYDHIIGIDNVAGATPIETFQFNYQQSTLFIFGEEGIGICDEILKRCDDILYITQYGSVRSINVSSASAIVMYAYTSKNTL